MLYKWIKDNNIYILVYCIVAITMWNTIGPMMVANTLMPRRTETVQLCDTTITEVVVQKLNDNKTIKNIIFNNCVIKNTDLYKTSILFYNCRFAGDSLSLSKIKAEDLTFDQCSGAIDYSFLSKLETLVNLTIINSELNDNNTPELLPSGVKKVCIKDNKDLSELSWINQSVVHIDCSNCGVLSLGYIARLSNIRTLLCDNCPIVAITEPFNTEFLETLSIKGMGLDECPGLKNLTLLSNVNVEGNNFKDISFLNKSRESLRSLNISNNPLAKESLENLSLYTNLEELYICGIKTQNLAFLEKLHRLRVLSAVNCNISDIQSLRSLNELAYVRLALNKVNDISPLNTSIGEGSLKGLDLFQNNINDIRTLYEMSGDYVVLLDNPINFETCNEKEFNRIASAVYYTSYADKEYGSNIRIYTSSESPKRSVVRGIITDMQHFSEFEKSETKIPEDYDDSLRFEYYYHDWKIYFR